MDSMRIDPTTTVHTASNRVWDVIVVGAGPAGSVTALGLARLGLTTLLVDQSQFPRRKVCGCCLNADALADLEQLGLNKAIASLNGVLLNEFCLADRSSEVRVALPEGRAVSRHALDALLIEQAISAGCEFLPGLSVSLKSSNTQREYRELSCRNSHSTSTLQSRVVVLATGLSAGICEDKKEIPMRQEAASRIGIGTTANIYPAEYRCGTIFMAVGSAGYVGLTQVEGGLLNIAAALDVARVRGSSPAEVCAEILSQAGFPLCPEMLSNDWRGTVGLTRQRPLAASNRLFAVGDAAGYVEPFTGEGMAWAIRGARVIVPFVERGVHHWSESLEAEWSKTLADQLAGRQRWCRAFARILRHPRLVRTGIALAIAFPSLGRAVVRHLYLGSVECH